MSTVVLNVRSPRGLAEGIRRAEEVLRAGGLVCFPTETVYGLGADALQGDAVARIFQAKGRPSNNPLIVHVADRERAKLLVTQWPEAAERLAERFWPGPLTLVLPRAPVVPDAVTAGGPTVGVRVPAHQVARALLASGLAIAAPSANRSMRLSPTTAAHVLRDLEGRVELILDGGATPGGIESTVVDLSSPQPRLLRPGLIAPAEIEAVVGALARPAVSVEVATQALPAPGMLARHYAPRTPLECVEDDGVRRVKELHAAGVKVGLVSHHPGFVSDVPAGVPVARMPGDVEGYAAALYAMLHLLDERGLERIVVALPPEGEEWLAVRDRLRRAAVPL